MLEADTSGNLYFCLLKNNLTNDDSLFFIFYKNVTESSLYFSFPMYASVVSLFPFLWIFFFLI